MAGVVAVLSGRHDARRFEKNAAELEQALTGPALAALDAARSASVPQGGSGGAKLTLISVLS